VRGERERARGLDAWRFHCCVAERGWFFVCAATFNCVSVAFLVPAHGSRRVRCSCVIVRVVGDFPGEFGWVLTSARGLMGVLTGMRCLPMYAYL